MKVFITTNETQGKRRNDFMNADPGELVLWPSECDREAVDGKCGCRRSFAGMVSHKAATTVIVADRPDFTTDDLHAAIDTSLLDAGWLGLGDAEYQTSFKQDVYAEVAGMYDFANQLPIGTVVERRGNKLQTR
jgi:hypothetical protein